MKSARPTSSRRSRGLCLASPDDAPYLEGKHDVLQGGEDGDQVEALEDEAYRFVAKLASPVVREGEHVLSPDRKAAFRGLVDGAD